MTDDLAFLAGGGEAARMIRERDWTDHPLGHPAEWSPEFKSALSLVLNSPESMILAWGPDLSFFFNETYFPLLGPRLPWAMGERFDKVWADGWEQAKPIIDAAYAGNSNRFVDLPWKLGTDRGVRDTWWTFSYSRVLDGAGNVAGLFIFTNETTDRVLSDAALRESAEQLRLVVDGAKDQAILTTDPEGTITSWSPGAQSAFGWSADEAVGRSASVIFTPEDRAAGVDAQELATAAANGRASDKRWHLTKSGQRVYMNGSVHPLPVDAQGRERGFLKIARDETERWEAERKREVADERLQLSLSAGNSIGTWDWDVLNDQITSDARFALLYGVDPERAAKGAPITEFFSGIHPEDLPRVQKAIGKAMTLGGGAFQAEYRLIGEAGRVRWVAAQGHCIFDDAGRCVRFPGVSFDITDRVKADEALRAAKAEREFVISLTAQQRAISDPNAILRMTAEQLGRRLNVNRVGFYYDGGPDRIRYGPSWTDGTLVPLTGEFAANTFGERAAQSRRFGKPIIFADSRHDPDGGLENVAASGVIAGIGMPVVQNGFWQGGIYINQTSVRAWTADEIAFVKEVAELTWLAVERAEAVLRMQYRIDRQDTELVEGAIALDKQIVGRATAESQVRQLQKMEAVGQLTGGIAHDFNNMLAVVIGGLNLAQRRLKRGDTDIARFIENAMDGATRAATLTQRLLAFSRQQPLAPEVIDGNKLVGGLADLLTRTLGEAVQLETVLGAGLWKSKADPNQLENAIVNLAVNARDAMPEGGKLTIDTSNAHVDDGYAEEADIKPGQYVLFAVTDTGTGMPPDVLARAFDPFFTTKGVGKGTGLGLSQVFGFARQSGGHVSIYSEVGTGTTIKLYLPRSYGAAQVAAPKRRQAAMRNGDPTEIVLVVEDEERVRNFSVEALRELGYTVIHASNGPEALSMIDGGQDVTVLFTDIVMPGMTGRQLADRAVEKLPKLKVIYTTGYTRNAVVHNGTIDPGTNFLPKPFIVDQLAAIIRNVLDSGVTEEHAVTDLTEDGR